jgi:hypothetical protein
VDDDVAVRVEVEALLPDRRADQGEWPVRGVEPLAQLRGPRRRFAIGTFTAAFLVAPRDEQEVAGAPLDGAHPRKEGVGERVSDSTQPELVTRFPSSEQFDDLKRSPALSV